MPPDVFFEIIKEPSIKESKSEIVNVVEIPDWRAENMAYLIGHYELQDGLQEKRLKQRARGYAVVNGELYKSGVIVDCKGTMLAGDNCMCQQSIFHLTTQIVFGLVKITRYKCETRSRTNA
jgi:hypothetical protein